MTAEHVWANAGANGLNVTLEESGNVVLIFFGSFADGREMMTRSTVTDVRKLIDVLGEALASRAMGEAQEALDHVAKTKARIKS